MSEGKTSTVSTYHASDVFYHLMRVNGYYFPKSYKPLFAVYSFLIISLGSFYLPAALTITLAKSETVTKDLSAFFTTLQVTFNCYGGIFKLIPFVLMLRKLKATQKLVAKLDARCNGEDEIAEQHRTIRSGRRISAFLIVVYLMYSGSTTVGAVINNRTPYQIYFPGTNWHRSRTEFYIVAIMELLFMDMACVQHAMTDSYPLVYVCLLTGHIRLLALRIRKLGLTKNPNDNEILQQLKMCIKDHKMIIELQDFVAPIISITIFVQFSLTAIMIGLTLINITFFSTNITMRMGCVAYVGAVTAQFFPICYFSQSLQDECINLTDTIFHHEWTHCSPEYRKMLVVFMQRSQMVMEFTAGKLFPINLNSFLKIGKFSFSLYALIKNMDFEEKYGLK